MNRGFYSSLFAMECHDGDLFMILASPWLVFFLTAFMYLGSSWYLCRTVNAMYEGCEIICSSVVYEYSTSNGTVFIAWTILKILCSAVLTPYPTLPKHSDLKARSHSYDSHHD